MTFLVVLTKIIISTRYSYHETIKKDDFCFQQEEQEDSYRETIWKDGLHYMNLLVRDAG